MTPTWTHMPPLPQIRIEPMVRAVLLEDLGRAADITTNDAAKPIAKENNR
jgi:hypothetical protein